MKKVLILVLFALCVGCDEQQTKALRVEEINPYSKSIVVYDGCEYIKCPVYGGNVLIHKGNCTNSIHYENKK